ncbi:FixH family protein [Blastomonas sp.]|uniref:FixH family protein n=1 Tax=Blastomonas sp. TaxID=1909299 RepID=UPI0035930357
MSKQRAIRPFTGWHMTAILVGFFAVIMAVNFTMARMAMTTFGGKVVENSYVASQQFNDQLDRAAAQDALGWDEAITLDADRHVRIALSKAGQPLAINGVTATLSHPLGRLPAVPLRFVADGSGGMRSVEPVILGRWRIDAAVRAGADEALYRSDLQ